MPILKNTLLLPFLFAAITCVSQTAEEIAKSGDIKMKAKNYSEAVKDYSIAIQMNETKTAEYIKKVNYYNSLPEERKALVDTSVTFEGRAALCNPYYFRGVALMELSKKDEAKPDFDMAVKIHPSHGGAWYRIGMIEKMNGRKEEACSIMSVAIGFGSQEAQDEFDNSFCWNISMEAYRNGLTQLNLRNYEAAIKEFDHALKVSPDSNSYMKRGQAYLGLMQNEKALADMNMAVKIAPRNAEIAYNRGLVELELDKNQEAFDDFTRAITARPDYFKAYQQRALAAEELGLKKAALYDYNNMIKMKPDEGYAYYRRGLILETEEDIKAACADFKKAADLGIEEAEAKLCKEKKTYKQKMDALDKE